MKRLVTDNKSCFIEFNTSVNVLPLPKKFTFPFYYEPHPLSIMAAKELQQYLETQTDWIHNFGLDANMQGIVIGKMFGVLVVQNSENKLGYLAAFSGKLAGANHHAMFVPPVYDLLAENSFFLRGETIISAINNRIETLENDPDYTFNKNALRSETVTFEQELLLLKQKIKQGKAARKLRRQSAEGIDAEAHDALLEELRQESVKEQYFLKDFNMAWKARLAELSQAVEKYAVEIAALKEERKMKSAALQQQIFDSYFFLNAKGNQKSLGEIFGVRMYEQPPAGAGECAAPKLLQYAFLHQLKPIALAEFWWGASPASEVRKHKQFYPACRGKCEPILGHMLQGLEVDENPFLEAPDENIHIETVYEDAHLVVINKPAEFLSVPGIAVKDSVYTRMLKQYPEATGPLIVHRLDMSTSGLMLIAKTKEAYHHLQNQFIKRTIKKRYVALLEGLLPNDAGYVNLPIRVDLDDRPRQLVCYEYGKPAQTRYEVIERKNGKTKVFFYPITGRTHQLRLHASHSLGLNAPIVGDDLYGTKSGRLHLHAEMLEFIHPTSGEQMRLNVSAPF